MELLVNKIYKEMFFYLKEYKSLFFSVELVKENLKF